MMLCICTHIVTFVTLGLLLNPGSREMGHSNPGSLTHWHVTSWCHVVLPWAFASSDRKWKVAITQIPYELCWCQVSSWSRLQAFICIISPHIRSHASHTRVAWVRCPGSYNLVLQGSVPNFLSPSQVLFLLISAIISQTCGIDAVWIKGSISNADRSWPEINHPG